MALMRPWSLALRLTTWYAAAAFLLVTGAAIVQYRTLVGSLSGEDDQLLLERLAAATVDAQSGASPYTSVVTPGTTRGPVNAPARASGDHPARPTGPPRVARRAPPARGLAQLPAGPQAEDGQTARLEMPTLLVRDLDGACRPLTTSARALLPDDARLPPPVCPDAPAGAAPVFRTWSAPDGNAWRIVRMALPARTDTAASRGTAPVVWREVLLNRSDDALVLRTYRTRLGTVLVATLLLAGALGHVIARRGLGPLAVLAARVEHVDATSLDQRLAAPDAPAEIRVLTRSFDGMLRRLEAAFRSLNEYSGHLAHEFRTPIHVLRQQAEIALSRGRSPEEYREVLASSVEELDRLNRMVDDILLLARTEDPRAGLTIERFRVGAELAAVVDYFDALAADAAIALDAHAPPDLDLRADRLLVRRALVNLVSNALRHTHAGGAVRLVALAAADPAWAERDRPTGNRPSPSVMIEVTDTGEGIDPEHLPHVFDRYYRAPSARTAGTGSGLGLSIVRNIMHLHGGTVTIASTGGRGTRVRLTFENSGGGTS